MQIRITRTILVVAVLAAMLGGVWLGYARGNSEPQDVATSGEYSD